jgi:lipopolysaccharide/colanic/teichoic acid biosynthesis glycosyltransferase
MSTNRWEAEPSEVRSAAGSEVSLPAVENQVDVTAPVPAVRPLIDATEIYAIRRGVYLKWVKPVLDRIGGVVALVLLSPLLIVIAAAIRVSMGRPVLLIQPRVGRHGKVFTLYKFRTMKPDRRRVQVEYIGENRRLVHKSAQDPRITSLGRWLRATRLDELPQFINVVRGDLSLVGPRPEMVQIVAGYEQWQHRRHAVKPGVTGLWQISDRGDKLLVDCTEMELEYLERITLLGDLEILAATLPAMFRRNGI